MARVAALGRDTEAADRHNRIALELFTQLATPEAAEVARELAGETRSGY